MDGRGLTAAGLRLEVTDGVGVVTLARPPVNAVDQRLLDALAECFARPWAHLPGARALVLLGEGAHFCAGHDRAEAELRSDEGFLMRAVEALAAVRDAPLPVVAGVQGGAVGTGLILAACADLLFVAPDAFVALPEVELGMLGGAGHAARWFPPAIVRRLVLLGERVSGEHLHAAGSALAPLPGASVQESARDAAHRLGSRSPAVVAAAREVLARSELDVVAIHREEMRRSLALDPITPPPAG